MIHGIPVDFTENTQSRHPDNVMLCDYRQVGDIEEVEVFIDLKKRTSNIFRSCDMPVYGSNFQKIPELDGKKLLRSIFPNAYKNFLKKTGAVGLDLKELGLAPDKYTRFTELGIKTVEQLANVTDTELSRLGDGSYEARNQAKDFLIQLNSRSKNSTEINSTLELQKALIDKQQAVIEELTARMAKLETQPVKRVN